MQSVNNILAVIAALLVTAQALQPNTGKDSYTYDPNSIIQHERILRLFLRLASETASRLIRLKNEARLRQDSTSVVGSSEPAFRIQLPDVSIERTIGNHQRHGKSVKSYDKNFNAGHYNVKQEATYAPAGTDSQVKKPNDEGNQGHPVLPAGKTVREEFDSSLQPHVPDNTTYSKDGFALLGNVENFINIAEDSRNKPVEIESRMIVEKKNYTSHEHLNTTSNPDTTKITSVDLPFTKQSAITETNLYDHSSPESMPIMGNVSVSPDPNVPSQKLESKLSWEEAGTSIKQPVTAASDSQSGAGLMVDQDRALTPDTQTIASAVAPRATEPATNPQFRPKDSTEKVPDLSSSESMTNQAHGSESNVPNRWKEVTRTFRGMESRVSSVNEAARISNRAISPESVIQSESKAMIDGFEAQESSGQSDNGTIHQVIAKASNINQLPTGQLSNLATLQDPDSKILGTNVSVLNENLANQMIASVARNANDEKFKSSDTFGDSLEPKKFVGTLSSLNPANVPTNQRSYSTQSADHAVSAIANVGSNTSVTLLQTVGNTGSRVPDKIHDPLLSVAQASSGQATKILGSLIDDAGSGRADTLIRDKANETIFNIVTSNKHDNQGSVVSRTNGGGISDIGRRLMGSLPIFREFPTFKSESGRDKSAASSIEKRKDKHENGVDAKVALGQSDSIGKDNSSVKYDKQREYSRPKESEDRTLLLEVKLDNYEDGTDNGILELKLHDFSHQFVDALRPLDSVQKV